MVCLGCRQDTTEKRFSSCASLEKRSKARRHRNTTARHACQMCDPYTRQNGGKKWYVCRLPAVLLSSCALFRYHVQQSVEGGYPYPIQAEMLVDGLLIVMTRHDVFGVIILVLVSRVP